MAKQQVKVNFDRAFKGTLLTDRGQVKLGAQEEGMSPYNLLLGALASCLYATFLEITEKKRITFDTVEIEVVGNKRDEVPTTLDHTHVMMKVVGAEEKDRKGIEKSLDLAAKYCSVYQTIAQVSEMKHEVIWDV